MLKRDDWLLLLSTREVYVTHLWCSSTKLLLSVIIVDKLHQQSWKPFPVTISFLNLTLNIFCFITEYRKRRSLLSDWRHHREYSWLLLSLLLWVEILRENVRLILLRSSRLLLGLRNLRVSAKSRCNSIKELLEELLSNLWLIKSKIPLIYRLLNRVHHNLKLILDLIYLTLVLI